MLGEEGLKKSTIYAILNANYIKARLEKQYRILYTGEKGFAAHPYLHLIGNHGDESCHRSGKVSGFWKVAKASLKNRVGSETTSHESKSVFNRLTPRFPTC